MNFNQNVEKEVVDAILESSLWAKAGINVLPRDGDTVRESSKGDRPTEMDDMLGSKSKLETIPEYSDGIANEYSEPTDVDISFNLEDLQLVLDNLEDEDLMEHALNMLEVFDVAYDTLLEDDDPDDEDEEDEDEDEEEEEDEKEEE